MDQACSMHEKINAYKFFVEKYKKTMWESQE